MNHPEKAQPDPLRAVTDLAGTPVVDSVGFPIGSVFGALIEADSGLVRYVDISVEPLDRHVLIPMGHTKLEQTDSAQRIRLRAATLEDLRTIPPFEPHGPAPDDETQDMLLQLHGRVFYGQRYYAHPCFDHGGLYAGKHPILVGPTAPIGPEGGIFPLSELEDFRVTEEAPDVRGWPALAQDDRYGVVEELLVAPVERKVRYAVLRRGREERRTAVPIGYLTVDSAAQEIRLPMLDTDELDRLPAYEGGPLEREQEEAIRAELQQMLSGERRFHRPDFATAMV